MTQSDQLLQIESRISRLERAILCLKPSILYKSHDLLYMTKINNDHIYMDDKPPNNKDPQCMANRNRLYTAPNNRDPSYINKRVCIEEKPRKGLDNPLDNPDYVENRFFRDQVIRNMLSENEIEKKVKEVKMEVGKRVRAENQNIKQSKRGNGKTNHRFSSKTRINTKFFRFCKECTFLLNRGLGSSHCNKHRTKA